MSTNILDLVYHEHMIRCHPELSVLRTDRQMRIRLMQRLLWDLPGIELGRAELDHFTDATREVLSRTSDPAVQATTLAVSIPAAAACWAAFRHWDRGAPVYVIGPRLQEMFTRTSLDAVKASDLRLPFDTIYIALPDCPWSLWGGKERHRVIGFFVQGLQHDGDGQTFTDVDLDGMFLIAIGEDLSGPADLGDDAIRTQPVDLRVGNIEENCTQLDPLYNALRSVGVNAEKDGETIRMLARIAVNTMLYLSAELPAEETEESRMRRKRRDDLLAEARRKKQAKAKKAEQRAGRLSPVSVVQLGASVEGEGPQGGTHESPRQHWVTGHWHAYWHGPRRSQRKLNWVRPFLRGDPQRGQMETRIYQTDAEPE